GRFYLLFPVCQILVYYILIYENVYGELAQEFTLTLLLAVFTVLSAANVIYLHYISDIEQNNRLILQLRDMEYAHKLEAEHYTRIEEKRYELAKLRHDFRNELSAVKKLISTGSSESARELIDDLERTLDSTAEYKYCSVPVIDAVVSEKEDIISRNDIRFEHSITVAGAENVQPVHLCSIFANLMDNAIKANLEIEDGRYISLASRIRGGTITVKCENPVSGKAAVPAPSRSTGYGLKILNDIASKYDGRFSVSAENGVCTAVVTLNLMCEN
ncbi:MAG: sensor histidine kinase, partial [Oscillospiraceae bacterium]|nr:sensor histidine kinase [Oscillospiraceae bacterium]